VRVSGKKMGAKKAPRRQTAEVGVAFAGFSLAVQHRNRSLRGAGNESGDFRAARPMPLEAPTANDGSRLQYGNRHHSDILFDAATVASRSTDAMCRMR